ncbi:MAG: hypothetical protein EXQ55_03640 [Acidobacteria bacterium]|nr:hypothetical protein [Acidobacteriota bacterium]
MSSSVFGFSPTLAFQRGRSSHAPTSQNSEGLVLDERQIDGAAVEEQGRFLVVQVGRREWSP